MPTIYVSTNFETSITLAADDDFVFNQWTDKKLPKEREEYEKPNKGIWLQIVNPNDQVEVFPIPITEKDIYEGALDVKRDGRKFSFFLNGKAKVSIHKTTKERLDSGLTPKVAGLMINGQEYPVDLPIEALIQSKKI
jgi:hypothetical protein